MRWFIFRIRPSFFIAILGFSFGFLPLGAQEYIVKQYLEKAGDCAVIYNGELETPYSFVYYDEFPYYKSNEYAQGAIYYKGKYYPNQRIRLDLYKNQLIVLTPKTNLGKIVNAADVDKFVLGESTFINYFPSETEKPLKQGYYHLIMEGTLFKVLGKTQKIPVENSGKSTYIFNSKQNYYLLYNGGVYTIRNASILTKLFPQLKKQLKAYVKDNGLNFKTAPEESLYQIVNYCEEIVVSTIPVQ